MYIHEHLKKLRRDTGQTLQELADKVGYGTGNLSSYETGKLQAKDLTLIRILTRGYDLTAEEAKEQIATWRREEIETKYNLPLAQSTTPYNQKSEKISSLEQALSNEGLNKQEIEVIKSKIKSLKKKK